MTSISRLDHLEISSRDELEVGRPGLYDYLVTAHIGSKVITFKGDKFNILGIGSPKDEGEYSVFDVQLFRPSTSEKLSIPFAEPKA